MVLYNINDIEQISFELKNDKVLICPTDTVNGLLSRNQKLLFKVKNRSKDKKIILFIPNVSYVVKPNEDFLKLAKNFWPGKLTLVFNNISYRVPNDDFILNLLEKTGPLYSTSANISGQKPIAKTIEAYETLNNKSMLIILEGQSENDLASTVYDVNSKKILRQGEIKQEEIRLCLK